MRLEEFEFLLRSIEIDEAGTRELSAYGTFEGLQFYVCVQRSKVLNVAVTMAGWRFSQRMRYKLNDGLPIVLSLYVGSALSNTIAYDVYAEISHENIFENSIVFAGLARIILDEKSRWGLNANQ